MKATLLCLFLAHAHAFEVLSGDCRLDTPGTGWFVLRTAAICVKQQSSRRGDCTFNAPTGLALRVKNFEVRAGDYLRVNGVDYSGDGGPEGFVPAGIIEWHGNATDPKSRFEVCRPLLPSWWYFFFGFGYCFGCMAFVMLFQWSRIATYVLYVVFILGLMFVLTETMATQFNGYVLDDAFFGATIGHREFYFDAPAFIWFTTYGFAIVFMPLSAVLFIRMRSQARRRTEELESELRKRIHEGCIVFLDVSWLLKQKADYILQRRQDLPDEAKIAPDLALKLLSQGRIGVLSYRWLKAHHPDPDGWHMQVVRDFLRGGFTRADIWSNMYHGGEASMPQALFWDYASLHQKDKNGNKTDKEKETFGKALRVMTYLYASPNSLVLQHKRLPGDFPSDQPTYEKSGWCTMESAASGLQTEGGGSRYELGYGWSRLRAGERKAPDEMAAIFANENRTKFVGNADRKDVAELYAKLHAHVLKYDQSRQRCFTSLIGGILDGFENGFGVTVEAWVALFWFGSLVLLAMAWGFMSMPSPFCIFIGSGFVTLFVFIPAVYARRFRQWHMRLFERLFVGSRVVPDEPPSASLRAGSRESSDSYVA